MGGQLAPGADLEAGGRGTLGVGGSLLANLLMLSVVVLPLLTHGYETGALNFLGGVATFSADLPDLEPTELYYRSVQEDEYLEWATFWGFIFSALLGWLGAWRQWRSRRRLPWFLLGVGLICLFVALEEISWGQRVLGYRPPEYFLEQNFQQELNVHNIVDTSLRKLLVEAGILGYGVALPGLVLFGPARRVLSRLAVVPPPVATIPGFYVAYHLYQVYPWTHTGELVELMLALGILFAAVDAARRFRPERGRRFPTRAGAAASICLAWVATVGAGVVHAGVSRAQRAADPELVRQASQEVEALERDFLAMAKRRGGRLTTGCGLHKRLYTYVRQYDRDHLLRGQFQALVKQGLSEERAEYFLDPWNGPYWIRHECEDADDPPTRTTVVIYSFGPNRRRDSGPFLLAGDDVGRYVLHIPDGAVTGVP